MPAIADFRPGCIIHNVNGARGTLTCFAIKPGRPQRLYAVTARHVMPNGSYCWLGEPFTGGAFIVGGPAKHIPGIDVLYFRIDDQYRPQLTQSNFMPIGQAIEPTQVWDPTSRRTKVQTAPSAAAETARKQATMPAIHIGATQTWGPASAPFAAPNPPTAGTVTKWTAPDASTRMSATQIAPGDSGGPVLHGGGLKYVGLISAGHTLPTSTSGDIVYLHDAFGKAGLALGTWSNRNHWQ